MENNTDKVYYWWLVSYVKGDDYNAWRNNYVSNRTVKTEKKLYRPQNIEVQWDKKPYVVVGVSYLGKGTEADFEQAGEVE